MKKNIFWYSAGIFLLLSLSLSGQSSSFMPGFRYQAMLRNAQSLALGNTLVRLKVSIQGDDATGETYYTEFHEVLTDSRGLFELTIGKGSSSSGILADLPWSKEQLWVQLEMAQEGVADFVLVNKSPLMAVPYALHAANAAALYDPSAIENDETLEKNQSIYWLTAGNSGTNPNVHYVGTRDNTNLVFKTNGKPYVTLTPNGKLQVLSDVPAGPDNTKSSYPVVVEGTHNTQGVWVEINGSRSKANNFVTFADDNGIQGRIEGQTLTELENSDSYKTQVEVTSLNAVALAGKLVELSVKIAAESASAGAAAVICGLTFGIVACSDVPANAAGAVASGVKFTAWVVELTSYLTATGTSFDRIRSKVGVSYSSGSGDYAEYLLRNPQERNLVYGEIVGVNGGVVSLNTAQSSRNMVVSQYPAFLGKTPAEGTEHKYEKIAFLGQVPVRVVGKVRSGDYILPSGKNDGMGIAIHPEDLPARDYAKIVGTAWESIHNELPFNLVKVGVGIKSNLLAAKVDALEQKVDNIMAYLEGKDPLFTNRSTPSGTLRSAPQNTEPTSQYSETELLQQLEQHATFITEFYAGMEVKLKAEGYPITDNPAMAELFRDPVNTLKKIQRNPHEFVQHALSKH